MHDVSLNSLKLLDLADRLQCRLEGSAGDVEIVGVAGIEQAQPGELTFIANARYHALLAGTRASTWPHAEEPCRYSSNRL